MDFNISESPPVKALGSLFKHTQSFLWDRGSNGRQHDNRKMSNKVCFSDKNCCSTYGNDKSWRRSDNNNAEKWGCSNLYLIGTTSTRKCDEVQASCGLQPKFCMPRKSRNNDTCGIKTVNNKNGKETKSVSTLSMSSDDRVLQEDTPSISKYWAQRYQLFSKFDDGIKMDEEGWYSVTPEAIAKHQANRCGAGKIVDLFTGVGGNAIQFAKKSEHVTAVDIDPNKIDYARHNAAIYGVEDKINFITADSLSLAPKLKADTVFMSPPWGGPDYSKAKKFDINTMLKPCDGQTLFKIGKEIAPKIAMFLPRNTDVNQLAKLALSTNPPWSLEIENNFLNGRLKAITAYFSEPSKSSHESCEDRW